LYVQISSQLSGLATLWFPALSGNLAGHYSR
jgi:hypothetical protein